MQNTEPCLPNAFVSQNGLRLHCTRLVESKQAFLHAHNIQRPSTCGVHGCQDMVASMMCSLQGPNSVELLHLSETEILVVDSWDRPVPVQNLQNKYRPANVNLGIYRTNSHGHAQDTRTMKTRFLLLISRHAAQEYDTSGIVTKLV